MLVKKKRWIFIPLKMGIVLRVWLSGSVLA
jgi:hypothetical protein